MWWHALTIFQQVLFIFGCCAGGILIISIIMTLIGMGGDSTFDYEADAALDADTFNNDGFSGAFGLKLLSFRSINAFVGVFSWTTFTVLFFWPIWGAVLLGVGGGLAAATIMAYALYSMQKLQQSGNISIENAVGKTADVYLRIGEARTSVGKIQITVQERLREYGALTDADRQLKTGEKVKVVGVVNEDTLLVEPF
ncbi:MAG: hypothetical protein FWH03_03460 [Firmicutes bacterium]|nr:hypothetical protein [Bacillota bacterium]